MRVFSNSAASIDGRIGTVAYDHVAVGSEHDRKIMSRLRAQADAVLVGGRTFRNWPRAMVEEQAHLEEPIHRDEPLYNVVLTRSGLLDAGGEHFPDARVRLLVLGGSSIDAEAHRQVFGAEVLQHAEPGLPWALALLRERGCRSILIEAGGALIFEALAHDLLDEVFLTLCPLAIGGRGAPTVVDGRGFSAEEIRRLSLLAHERVGDELYLHYRVKRG